jgi:hypothetical protein
LTLAEGCEKVLHSGCREKENVRRALSLLSIALLSGCAGYASDYWKSKKTLIAPQLERFGMTGTAGKCVEERLTKELSVWQLRQLGDYAARVAPSARVGPREFVSVAGLVEDSKVGPVTRAVIESCRVTTAAAPARPGATPSTGAGTAGTTTTPGATTSAGPEPLWVNLGAAQTGQGIAVDASSVTRGPSWRQAWFRLLNTDQAGVGDIGYLLRIECSSKVITAHAGRKYAPGGGGLVEQRQYDKPEGPMGIEPGTVIEVAYHALCDDPK